MKNILFFLISGIILTFQVSCSGPETIIADTGDLLPGGQGDTTNASTTQTEPSEQDFTQLVIGEVAPIFTLDPLFASSSSELRVANLLYDGLTAINQNGEITPALAKSWEVNRDSTRFTFVLHNDAYFHNSGIFGSGVGRAIRSSDIEFIFKRMGFAEVPDLAAQKFTHIKGFEAYHKEQTFVKNPRKRAITRIEGIEMRSDSTVLFVLNESDPDFLHKLAHPLASVYPQESLRPSNSGLLEDIAGTGPLAFVQKENGRLIFRINDRYYNQEKLPDINRLDIYSGLVSRDLFQNFARGEIDLLIEINPSILYTATRSDGSLVAGYEDSYNLIDTNVHENYSIYFNEGSERVNDISSLLATINPDSLIENRLGNLKINIPDSSVNNGPQNALSFTHTEHPTALYLIEKFAERASSAGRQVSLNASYALSSEVTFSTQKYPDTIPVIEWSYPVYILTQEYIQGISITHYPWNIDLSNIQKNNQPEP